MSEIDSKAGDKAATKELRAVPITWEALEDAFENNAHEVHSYLHVGTGEVIRVVDGIADPAMHHRIMGDSNYLRIDPVSSREQYRWMERFIATVEDGEFRQKLVASIDGKGAFRRFKDVLMAFPSDRERWFTFRSERLRSCMETWLNAHGIAPIERPAWRAPEEDAVDETVVAVEPSSETAPKRSRSALVEANRARAHELVDAISGRELETAVTFLEFLKERRAHRAKASDSERPSADVDSNVDDDAHRA